MFYLFYWFILSSFLVVLITCTKVEVYKFLDNKHMFKKCIADYLSEVSYLNIGEAVTAIADIVSEKFYGKTLDSRQFSSATNYYYRTSIHGRSDLFDDNKIPLELKMSIREALKHCVERKNLPAFYNEPQVLTDFLNFILVDWPTPLKEMISTRSGRSTLRLYAYSAGVKLMSALKYFSTNSDVFDGELKRVWMLRAEQYFDGRDDEFIYIRHRFTTDRDRMYSSIPLEEIHTIDDVNLFYPRKLEYFLARNPIIRRRNLDIFEPGASHQIESFYPKLSQLSMTSAENYLETYLNQCYRIIFFALELQLRSINSDEDDIYSGRVPDDVMPFFMQDLVWNNAAYQTYLASLWEHFEKISNNEHGNYLSSTRKEDLIQLLTLTILKVTASTMTTASTTTLMTTKSTEFPDYIDISEKDSTSVWDYRKYFLPKKRFGKVDTNCKSYGYVINSHNFNRFMLLKEDQSESLKILREVSLIHRGVSQMLNSLSRMFM